MGLKICRDNDVVEQGHGSTQPVGGVDLPDDQRGDLFDFEAIAGIAYCNSVGSGGLHDRGNTVEIGCLTGGNSSGKVLADNGMISRFANHSSLSVIMEAGRSPVLAHHLAPL